MQGCEIVLHQEAAVRQFLRAAWAEVRVDVRPAGRMAHPRLGERGPAQMYYEWTVRWVRDKTELPDEYVAELPLPRARQPGCWASRPKLPHPREKK